MIVDVSFTAVRAATRSAAEDAHLIFADQQLVALLVPAQDGWFLQVGFGPCDREGLIFETLSAAASWVRECFRARQTAVLPGAR